MNTYYFVGIKGSGMSALAQLLFDRGNDVLGSDSTEYYFTEDGLRERNITVLEFDEMNIDPGYVYIIGNAFDEENEEVSAIKKKNYTHYKYNEFLSCFMKEFVSIGVSGTHGKTTTTSILSHILRNSTGVNSLIGDGTGHGDDNSNLFVFEACEYKGTFLKYSPDYILVNNIDYDHPDFFNGIKEVESVFKKFSEVAKTGLVTNGDDPIAKTLKNKKKVITFGLCETNDYSARNIEANDAGLSYDLYIDGTKETRISVPLFGIHNVYNSLASVTLATLSGLKPKKAANSLLSYSGAKRRFSIEKFREYHIVNDYAHHPSEIEATIQAARQRFPGKKLITIFQPHTFSRLRSLSALFKSSLSKSDGVFICDIFASEREKGGKGEIDEFFQRK